MDYKITDWHLDPSGNPKPGIVNSWKGCRIATFCFTPFPDSPPSTRCLRSRGVCDLCCFPESGESQSSGHLPLVASAACCRDSRLILKARGLNNEATRQRLREAFAAHGIGAPRLVFEEWGDMNQYLARFDEVDIALDSVPFNGGTTSFHALWMGVPVVTLAGEAALGRMGNSILRNLSLPELVARTPDEFAEICARLAGDKTRLVTLRREQRQRMEHSPLMDGVRFTRNLELAYRTMWRNGRGGRSNFSCKN
jgi:hypothetical protein